MGARGLSGFGVGGGGTRAGRSQGLVAPLLRRRHRLTHAHACTRPRHIHNPFTPAPVGRRVLHELDAVADMQRHARVREAHGHLEGWGGAERSRGERDGGAGKRGDKAGLGSAS
jgi:hypothetical protein